MFKKGSTPTCATADGGILLFGSDKGNITLTDRNFKILWVNKSYNGPVRGISYIYDIMNHKKQYLIAIGEEFRSSPLLSTTGGTSPVTTTLTTTLSQGENKSYYIKVITNISPSVPTYSSLFTPFFFFFLVGI